MRYVRAEAANTASAWEDLPPFHLANVATEVLAVMIGECPVPGADEDDAPPGYWHKKAVFFLAVIGLRAARAAMVLVAAGYGPEALGQMRTVMEVHNRIERVLDDPHENRARNWFKTGDGKPGKHADVPELWATLSHSAHADRRAVENFLAVSEEGGNVGIVTGPERRAEVDSGTLLMIAGQTRDVAAAMARLWEVPFDASAFDAEMRTFPLFAPPDEPTPDDKT